MKSKFRAIFEFLFGRSEPNTESISRPNHPLELAIGTKVRVRKNERNRTLHIGTIREAIWHFKEGRYFYLIEVDGQSIKKRYWADDLETLDP